MHYKLLAKFNDEDPQIYLKVDDDGIVRCSCDETDKSFQEWLAEGNTPQPAD